MLVNQKQIRRGDFDWFWGGKYIICWYGELSWGLQPKNRRSDCVFCGHSFRGLFLDRILHLRFECRFPEDGFRSRLYVDKEDEKILKDAVIKRGLTGVLSSEIEGHFFVLQIHGRYPDFDFIDYFNQRFGVILQPAAVGFLRRHWSWFQVLSWLGQKCGVPCAQTCDKTVPKRTPSCLVTHHRIKWGWCYLSFPPCG